MMRFKVKSFISINRFYIFLMLLMTCIFMLIVEAIFPKTISNRLLLNKQSLNFFDHRGDLDDDALQRLKDYEADPNEFPTAPKLPFSLDQFGDYEPVFLEHKVVPLERKLTANEKIHFNDFNEMREHMLKDRQKLIDRLGKDAPMKYLQLLKSRQENDKLQNKSSINRPPFSSSTSSYLFENLSKSSSKQAIIKRHMQISPVDLASMKPGQRLNLETLDKISENVKKLNEQSPLSILRFQAKDITKINRIYILSYFRSGSSFLGDLLQQHYRTFYQFEPLHFRSVASRLPTNDPKTEASISLVLHMLNQCDFRGKATASYLNWIVKEDNKFLLSWNHFLYSLCRYNQSKCSDERFVEQVCNLAEQRVTKLTRVNLVDLIKVLNSDDSFEDYVREFVKMNSSSMSHQDLSKLIFRIPKLNNSINENSQTISSSQISSNRSTNLNTPLISTPSIQSSPLSLDVEPIKIIYLVRDPRAVYSSRQHLGWCKNRASCVNVDKLCEEMNQDFKTFELLYSKSDHPNTVLTLTNNTTKYPVQLFLVRFETIALQPFNSTSQLFKLVNLPFKENIKRFVSSHTASNSENVKTAFRKWYLNKVSNDPHSTRRNSTKIPFDWIHKLSWPKIDEIQSKCRYSMDRLGYRPITNEQFKNIPKNLTELLMVKENNFTLF